jgi:hypothetical protein
MPVAPTTTFRKTFSQAAGLFISAVLASSAPAYPQTGTVSATIDVSKTGAPISKYI